jgi:hypothetical protein
MSFQQCAVRRFDLPIVGDSPTVEHARAIPNDGVMIFLTFQNLTGEEYFGESLTIADEEYLLSQSKPSLRVYGARYGVDSGR